MSFNLLSNGSTGDAINSKFVPENFQNQSNGSYMWSVTTYINGQAYDGYAMILYPVGVNVVDYKGSVVNTDTSRVRIWNGNGDVTNDAAYVYYKN